MNQLPGKAMGALKSKGMAFQWQPIQKAAGGLLSVRADVSARFKRNWELANGHWENHTETLTHMAPTALIAPTTHDAAGLREDSNSMTVPEEQQDLEAARKAGLSESQYRHMMTHYRTLRPKTYLKMLAEKEQERLAGAGEASEAPVLGANAEEEQALGKRREKIHESRRLRLHTKHKGDTLYPLQ